RSRARAEPERDATRNGGAEPALGEPVEIRERVPDDALLQLYLGWLAGYSGPLDEDYGYVTIEGMAAARPVVVTSDSGGPLEFVHDEENGSIVDPEPEAIAAAFDRLFTDRQLAQRMGSAGRT